MSRIRSTNSLTRSATAPLRLRINNPNPHTVRIPSGHTIAAGGTLDQYYDMEYGGLQSIYQGHSGEIEDNFNPPAPGLQYNRVRHVQVTADCPEKAIMETGPVSCIPWGTSATTIPCQGTVTGTLACGDVAVGVTTPVIPGWATLQARATSTMKPGSIPASLDLPLFIAELTDFGTLWKSCYKRMHEMIDLAAYGSLGNSKAVFKRFVKRDKRHSLVDRLVSTDLSWKLAISPFLRDVDKLINHCSVVERAYNLLASPKPFRVYGRAEESAIQNPHITNLDFFKKVVIVDVKRTVYTWALVKRDILGLTQMDAFRAAYGLNVRLSTIWELIPLSFVLDYVINIGNFLSQFDGTVLDLPYSIIDSGTSMKEVVTYSASKVPFGGSDVSIVGLSGAGTVYGTITNKSYIREPGDLPWDSSVILPIQTSLPNFDQIGTMVELLYASLRRKGSDHR